MFFMNNEMKIYTLILTDEQWSLLCRSVHRAMTNLRSGPVSGPVTEWIVHREVVLLGIEDELVNAESSAEPVIF